MEGAEPFSAVGGTDGVLVLHGFTGNCNSIRGLAETFADVGMSVEAPLLPGHGTVLEEMMPLRFADWAEAAEEAYVALLARCSRVAIAGLSMGGGLACWLAERHKEIPGLILINPLVSAPADDFCLAIEDLVASGTEMVPGIGSDIADPESHEISYTGTPLRCVLSLFDGVREVGASLGEINCPVLLFSSRDDHVVLPSNGDLLQAKLSGPCERVWLERSYHVATLDYDRNEIEERSASFVRTLFSE
jgi:carboxylesterase